MNELCKKIVEVCNGVIDGSIPLATAKEFSRAADRHWREKREDCRMQEMGMIDERLQKSLKAMRDVE